MNIRRRTIFGPDDCKIFTCIYDSDSAVFPDLGHIYVQLDPDMATYEVDEEIERVKDKSNYGFMWGSMTKFLAGLVVGILLMAVLLGDEST